MDFFTEDDWKNQDRPPFQPHDVMITAAIVLSVIAIATSCCVYSSLVCGSLSIILALLSRGQQKKLTPQGKLAITTSVAAIILAVFMTIFLLATTIQQYGSFENFLNAYSSMLDSIMGASVIPDSGI